jgi:hypothetical protein
MQGQRRNAGPAGIPEKTHSLWEISIAVFLAACGSVFR